MAKSLQDEALALKVRADGLRDASYFDQANLALELVEMQSALIVRMAEQIDRMPPYLDEG